MIKIDGCNVELTGSDEVIFDEVAGVVVYAADKYGVDVLDFIEYVKDAIVEAQESIEGLPR